MPRHGQCDSGFVVIFTNQVGISGVQHAGGHQPFGQLGQRERLELRLRAAADDQSGNERSTDPREPCVDQQAGTRGPSRGSAPTARKPALITRLCGATPPASHRAMLTAPAPASQHDQPGADSEVFQQADRDRIEPRGPTGQSSPVPVE